MTIHEATSRAGWNFDNSYSRLPHMLFDEQEPNPVDDPRLVILNEPLAASLGLNAEALREEEGLEVLAGNRAPEGAEPIAQAYAGHQFGHFTMLGDGRALLLGEQIAPNGARYDIQLKGSGPTKYSRRGDGRAALGPMLREHIISEAMHALGIPTTRSLAVAATGDPVFRETVLPGAVLTRVAASHLRVGTFQYAANWGTAEDLYSLADYAIERHYPEIAGEDNRYLAFLRAVIARQASLIAKWQLVGFIHGVMNTDNMAISGETIDYGPCAFMDAYDPATVFSSIDANGRYAYGNQPYIGVWNLARLAESLLPILHEDQEKAVKLAEEELAAFTDLFHRSWLSGMRGKLGLFGEEEGDEALVKHLLDLMKKHAADYTNTFLALTFDKTEKGPLYEDEEFAAWREEWLARRGRQEQSDEDTLRLMRESNPAVIPRNHRVEEALDAAVKGDLGVMERLLRALADPYVHSAEQAEYASVPEACGPYRTFCGT
ncbi:YdiU family protein [Paenibacillus sp. LHD-117]|uniref:protein adenylyltransferase SelO n=1 Tax=Paenibacillus sp. LHD-117 TaxID=3071412 RepID=UPI0027E135DA|nr:YdiU family protein [Paenibacillus sp. LHD-117]MDQ6420212.1 YdiU family protein [Paenibacillus sp. LHD-117]